VQPPVVQQLPKMWSGENKAESKGIFPDHLRSSIGPLLIIIWSQVMAIVIARAVKRGKGDLIGTVQHIGDDIKEKGPLDALFKNEDEWLFADPGTWEMIGVYMLVQLILMKFMPGPLYDGPISPMGNVPVYKDNCFLCYIASFYLFALGVYFELFKGGIVYDKLENFIASMNLFALLFCVGLYVKGSVAPSSTDSGLSGNMIFDYYWGTELYPRIFDFDVKVFTNCRFGMTGWALMCVSFALKQAEDLNTAFPTNSIMISAALQVIYLAKFHIWERGYMYTIDIMHDRAGYYICWGCLVWVPIVYTVHTAFLVKHPYDLNPFLASFYFALGVLAIYLNYDVDRQRQEFRANDGKLKIWGKDAKYLIAHYMTDDGRKHTSKLVYSGWWGQARKINYFFELCAAFSWCMPLFHPKYFLPWFYFVFLFVLLVDRAWRDDARCESKYGKKWEAYKTKVPYMLIPGVY